MPRPKGPQTQQAYDYVKNKILSFELAPGFVVSDITLAQELGMSRSPIREAIMKLNADGLIEMKNMRMRVASMSLEDILEICQVREAVEVAAINIIKEKGGMTPQEKKQLTGVFRKLQSTEDIAENYYYDDLFHGTIINTANNKRLTEISDRMRLQIARARWLNFVLPNHRMAEANKEHEAIFQALLNDDWKASVTSLQTHLQNSTLNFKKVLSSSRYSPQFNIAMASISRIQKENL